MRYTNKLLAYSLAALLLAVIACDTEELHDLNVNPQAVNEIDLNYLFSAAELSIASGGATGDNRYIDWRTNIGLAAYAIQHLANAGGGIAPGDKYTDNTESSTAPFEYTYNDQLKNIAEILKQTGEEGYDAGHKVNMRNAARILRVFSYHRLTDFYGNVPYSEANRGLDGIYEGEQGILFPTYDEQPMIYADLFKELEEATAALSEANPDEGFLGADMLFGGDGATQADQIVHWKKWGYSLMLRLALRVSNVDPAMANDYATKAIAGGVFASNDDNVVVPMDVGPSEWTNQNGISRAFYPGDGGQPSYLSKTLVDYLKGANPGDVTDDDPRLMIISGGIADWDPQSWTPTNVDPLAQKGMPNGFDQGMLDELEGTAVDQAKTYSRINYLMLQDDEPYMIMHYAEVEFLMAEALERGIGSGIAGAAADHYAAGVKAAMQSYTLYDPSLVVSDEQVAAYLATYPYGVTKPALEMIGEQMWVSKFLNWWEAWSDWRRTDYPQLTPTNYQGNVTGGVIPTRLLYPPTEVAGNPNFSEGATLPNTYITKVWWDGGE